MLILVASYAIITFSAYLAWPSKWNIIGHMNAVFAFVAYFVPIVVVRVQDSYSPEVVGLLESVMAVGAVSYLVGVGFGTEIARSGNRRIVFRRDSRRPFVWDVRGRESHRLALALVLGIGLTLLASKAMGGLPIFSADPLAAKYFRGEAQSSYQHVAVIYRLGTGALTVLPPLAFVMLYTSKAARSRWFLLSAVSVLLMIATLQRGPMAEGVLLAIGLVLISRHHGILYGVLMMGVYSASSLFYSFLSVLGIGQVGGGSALQGGLARAIANQTPDVSDTLSLLTSWQAQGSELTYGRTFFGGLVPGQNKWNPAVWSLVTQNMGADINSIYSGGLRLPVPVWGLVSFGKVGVVLVPALAGLVFGLVLTWCREISKDLGLVERVVVIALGDAVIATIGSFYISAYLEYVKAAMLLWVVWPLISNRWNTQEVGSPRTMKSRSNLRGLESVASRSRQYRPAARASARGSHMRGLRG